MTTVKELKELGVPFVRGDKYIHSGGEVEQEADGITLGWFAAGSVRALSAVITHFAWRPLNTLPDDAKFKYELDFSKAEIRWRPSLDQSGVKVGEPNKPVFTQAMADMQRELDLHKANSELLAALTDFMVKNNIGKIGESCIDVAIRELSEKHNIDTRTPKQKAVDAASLAIEMKHGYAADAYDKYCETLYDAGLLK